MKECKKKLTTSKKLLYICVGQFLFVLMVTCAAVFVLEDATPLIYMIPASGTVAGLAIPFYINKSKTENSKGGITYDTVMAELQSNCKITPSGTESME